MTSYSFKWPRFSPFAFVSNMPRSYISRNYRWLSERCLWPPPPWSLRRVQSVLLLQRLFSNKQQRFSQVNLNTIAVVFPRDLPLKSTTNQNVSFPPPFASHKDSSRIQRQGGWGRNEKTIIRFHVYSSSCYIERVSRGIKTVLKTKHRKTLSGVLMFLARCSLACGESEGVMLHELFLWRKLQGQPSGNPSPQRS